MRSEPFVCPSGGRVPSSVLGFGGAPLGNLFAAIPEAEAQATLAAAWDAGMRLYDTAPLYGLGLSEARIGRFLAGKPREQFAVSTKIGRVLEDCAPDASMHGIFVDTPKRRFDYDYSYDGVLRSLEQSLERFGLDRVDVLLAHDVDVWTHGSRAASDARIAELMAGGYRAMVRLREEGVVTAIGAGVNEWDVAERLAREGDFDLFLLAGRYTLLEQEALASFLPLCVARRIGVMLGGPFNSGVLATGARSGAVYNYNPAPPEILARVERIERVCAAHGVAIAEAALAFPLAHPAVFTIIPGARAPQEVSRAVATLGARIPSALWSALKAEGLLRADAPTPAPTSAEA